jgi:putative phage-type endonuclease
MFNKEDEANLLENACILIEAYINLNTALYIQPNFHSTVVKDVSSLLNRTIRDVGPCVAVTETINRLVEEALQLFYTHITPPRSNGPTFIRKKPNTEKMQKKINYLQQVPQPEQRTPEWYEFRYQHLTASNIWKAFGSDSTRNQLIFEKCQPLNAAANKFSGVNFDSPMHWGQKYEPVSIQLYEEKYQTHVSDFGCIPHKTLDFLAASPDGIVTDTKAAQYGRMLEVKNIVNREITGNPKPEYWVQMQVQLEVCDLNECDFLETRFIEYPNEEAFTLDIKPEVKKGCMMLFMQMGGQPVYEYAPLTLNPDNYPQWQEEMMEKHANLNWLKNIYWKLDQLSCVLVLRNKLWFAAALPAIKDIWQTIQEEKKSGYAHRGPKKTTTNVKKLAANVEFINMPSKCFINIET